VRRRRNRGTSFDGGSFKRWNPPTPPAPAPPRTLTPDEQELHDEIRRFNEIPDRYPDDEASK
jgi:hypothetical protein